MGGCLKLSRVGAGGNCEERYVTSWGHWPKGSVDFENVDYPCVFTFAVHSFHPSKPLLKCTAVGRAVCKNLCRELRRREGSPCCVYQDMTKFR